MFWALGGAFLGGVWATPLFIDSPRRALLLLGLGLLLGALLLRSRLERRLASVLAVMLIGVVAASWRSVPLPELSEASVSVLGTVTEVREENLTLRLSEVTVDGAAWRGQLEARVRLSPEPRTGDRLELWGRLSRPDELPHGWRARGIVGRMSFPDVKRVGFRPSPLSFFQTSHERINQVIRRVFPDPEAGFLSGILLGDRVTLSDELKEALNRTGTTHLIAVSGFNVAIVVAFVWLLRGWVPYRVLIGLSGLILVGFVFLVGPSSSVVRAALMGLLILLAKGLGRPAAAGRLLLVAAVIMAAWNPWVLRDDLGFLLSFAATAGIIWMEPLITPRLGRWLPAGVAGLLGATLAAQIATEPLIVASFGRVSLSAVFINMLVIPLIPLAMLAGAAVVAIGLVSAPAAELGAWAVWPILRAILGLIEEGSRLPAVVEVSDWPGWLTLPFYLFLAFSTLLWRKLKQRGDALALSEGLARP